MKQLLTGLVVAICFVIIGSIASSKSDPQPKEKQLPEKTDTLDIKSSIVRTKITGKAAATCKR